MQDDSPAAPALQPGFEPAQNQTRRSFLRFIIDHNPCYLLSGACMLLGCWLLNFALYTRAGDIHNLLLLLLVINLYEMLLITLGLFLIKRVAFKRDGRILLSLQALFLVDVTFTSGMISTIDLHIGLLINLAVLILAALKVSVILHNLRLPGAGRMSVFIMLEILVLLAIPTIYKWIALPRHGHIPALAVYATWWLAGLLPMIGLLMHRLPSRRLLAPPGIEHAMGIVFIILPFASLLVHLYSAAWVYSIDFTRAFVAPVLLGLALAVNFLESSSFQRYRVARWQCLCIGTAIFFSLRFPSTLLFWVPRYDVVLSPLRLTLLVAALLLIYFIWRHDSIGFLWTALLCFAAALLGPTTAIIWQNLTLLVISSRRLMPRTTLHWGITSIATSFILLIVGALLSFKRNITLHRSTS